MSELEIRRGLAIAGTLALMGAAVVVVSCAGWQTPSPICIEGAHLDKRGQCRAQPAQEHHIPFRAGQEVRVTQSYHGFETHHEELAYAIDFACEEGTPVTASRDGVVWSVRDDSNESCPTEECIDDANYVILDHGDGTYSAYFHLQYKGAIVEPGDQVCRGQVLGLCGDTGFASGPHLHFSVLGPHWSTIPVAFEEVADDPPGVLLPRERYTSQNRRTFGCRSTDYSRIGYDGFAHRGILLRETLPMMIEDEAERTMRVEGVYGGQKSHVAIHRRSTSGGEWIEQCVEVDDEGAFSFDVDWPEQIFDEGYYFLMLTGADDDCSAPGWAWAYRVRVR